MPKILSDLSSPALISANARNLYEAVWVLHDSWKQAHFYESSKLRRWWSPFQMAFIFNAAVSLRPPEGDEAGLIGETIADFRARGSREFDWWLYPGLETSDWGRQLLAHGLTFEEGVPGMALELANLPAETPGPAGLTIRRVTDAAAMRTWNRVFIAGYGLPPDWEANCLEMMLASLKTSIICYLATVNGEPVATSFMFPYAGVAGIYSVATLPAWRGQGLGAAMTLQPLREARALGYQAGILQSSNMGFPVYQRLGFKELCRMNFYHWQDQADPAQ
jgi:GNAT superfamily N-acetyltransferase